MTSQIERVWVMVVRKRKPGEDFAKVEAQFTALCNDPSDWSRYIKDVFTVFGHDDVIVVIEAESRQEIYAVFQCMLGKIADCMRSTTTCIAVLPDKPYPKRNDNQLPLCMGVNCSPGQPEYVAKELRKLKFIRVADIVFGDFDIIAMIDRDHGGKTHHYLNEIAKIKGIEKTTTMIGSVSVHA